MVCPTPCAPGPPTSELRGRGPATMWFDPSVRGQSARMDSSVTRGARQSISVSIERVLRENVPGPRETRDRRSPFHRRTRTPQPDICATRCNKHVVRALAFSGDRPAERRRRRRLAREVVRPHAWRPVRSRTRARGPSARSLGDRRRGLRSGDMPGRPAGNVLRSGRPRLVVLADRRVV
jgi:hypothetical protein